MHKRVTFVLIATLILSLWASACFAADQNEKKDRRNICVLHAAMDKDYRQGMNNIRYKTTIWLRNVSGEDLDNITCRLKVHEGAKVFYEETQDVKPMGPGHRLFVVFKWEDYKDFHTTPEIFIKYKDSEGKDVEYQAFSPTWEMGS